MTRCAPSSLRSLSTREGVGKVSVRPTLVCRGNRTLFWLKALEVPEELADPWHEDASRAVLRARLGASYDQLLACVREPRQPRRAPSERLPPEARLRDTRVRVHAGPCAVLGV